MKILNPILYLSVIFSACGSSENKDQVQNNTSDSVLKNNNEEFMALYYLNDDKYAIDDPVININEWIQRKIKFVRQYGDSSSLFQRKGGGPAGSEWNPSNDLFLLAKINTKNDGINAVTCLLNGSNIGINFTEVAKSNQSVVYGLIPFHKWDSLLYNNYEKPIPDPELEIPPDIDLYYLKFSVQISFKSGKTTTFNEYFFSAFGE